MTACRGVIVLTGAADSAMWSERGGITSRDVSIGSAAGAIWLGLSRLR